jgi:hypothetical protein
VSLEPDDPDPRDLLERLGGGKKREEIGEKENFLNRWETASPREQGEIIWELKAEFRIISNLSHQLDIYGIEPKVTS